LVALVAALHVYVLVLEMFLWTKPLGLKTFRHSLEKATGSAVLAANQGLYNGFLAAGLVWGLVQGVPALPSRSRYFSCSASSSPASMAPRPSAAESCWCRRRPPRSR
jgi:putative membrane protein